MREYETYRCNKCGNEVEVCKVGGGVLICCGDDMDCITNNLTSVNVLRKSSSTVL